MLWFPTLVLLIVILALLSAIRKRLDLLHGDLRSMAQQLQELSRRLDGQSQPGAPTPAAKPATVTAAPPDLAPRPPLPAAVPPPPTPIAPPRPATVVTPPPAPKPRSRLVESATEILHKMWNWILVGEEHRPQGVTVEYAVATTWLLRLGILACVLCVAYFLLWSAQRELIAPVGRVAIALSAGLVMLVAGVRLLGRKYHLLGQGLLGGGLLVLYFGVFAMGMRYHLVPPLPAFGLMMLVTLTAGVLALRLDSLLVAVIGLSGGYLTPALIRTPTPNLAVLYAYILLLGVGILALAVRKQWRLLNYLSFIGTYALFIGSLFGPYHANRDFPLAMSSLTAFFLLHSTLGSLYAILRRVRSTTLETVHLAANAVVYAGLGYSMIREAWGRPYPALLALGLASFFTAQVLLLIRRRIEDRKLVVVSIALAGAFATWTLPLVMEKESLTLALALLAFTFLWLGQAVQSRFLQSLAHTLYLAVFVRLLVWDFDRGYAGTLSPNLPWREYGASLLDRLMTFGTTLASVVGAFWLQQRQPRTDPARGIPPAADTPALLPAVLASGLFYWTGLVFLFVFLNLEVTALCAYAAPWRWSALTVVWCGFAAYFLFAQDDTAPRGVRFWAMTGVLVAAAVKVLTWDLAFWGCHWPLRYAAPYGVVPVGARLLDFGVLLAAFLLVWRIQRAPAPARGGHAMFFGYGALLILFIYATLELNTCLYWKLPRFQTGGMSMLWGLFAIAFIAGGIWKNVTALRYLGLGLVAVVIAKVFLVDLRDMEMIVRVVAFLALGILLLLGSFAYMHSNRKFTHDGGKS